MSVTISVCLRFSAILLLLFQQSLVKTENVTTTQSSPSASELVSRREFIKNITLEAWNVYKEYAWGDYAVVPTEKSSPSGLKGTGGTIVSSLSTLHLMGLMEQFNQGREWVREMNFSNIDTPIVVYKVITEQIGGLLSTYALTGDQLFLRKAIEVGEAIKGAFNTKTVSPTTLYNPKKGVRIGTTTEIGFVSFEQPELGLLANLGNDTTWLNRLGLIRNFITTLDKPKGLFPMKVDVETGLRTDGHVQLKSVNSELLYNLIRTALLTPAGTWLKWADLGLYRKAMKSYQQAGMFNQSIGSGYLFPNEYNLENSTFSPEPMLHDSSCQLGAMFALAGWQLELVAQNSTKNGENSTELNEDSRYQWALARNLTRTCAYVADQTKTKLLPVLTVLTQNSTSAELPPSVTVYRPFVESASELAETYFILWRLTREPVWREKAWELAQAIPTYHKTPNGGYASIIDANTVPVTSFKGAQDPRWISATFKYLYLTQVEDEGVLPLDKWVFNAAGHPLPVCGQHPTIYPKTACRSN